MKYFKLFEQFVIEEVELVTEGAWTGKQMKDLKKAGWTYSKSIDGGTLGEISTVLSNALKAGELDTEERNPSGWKVAKDDNMASWEMLTFTDEIHGPIKLVSYKEDPFNDRKYGTLLIKLQDRWWYKITTYKDITTDIVNCFANPNRVADATTTDKLIGAFEYFNMRVA